MMISVVLLTEVFLLAVALSMGVMALVALLRRRKAPASRWIALITAAAGCYCFGYAFESAQTTLSGAIFWLRVEYIGIPWIPAFWLILTRNHFGLRSSKIALSVIPVIVTIAEWTNSFHGLYDRSMMLVQHGPFWVVEVQRGPIAWLNLAYLYAALTYTTALCLGKIRTSDGLIRWQTALFGLACIPPLLGHAVYLVGLSPWGLDLAPVALCLTVLIGYVTVFRLESFNLVPMARSLVFKSMRDAVLVTDVRHRLVDFNPAARTLFPVLSDRSLGQDIAAALPECEALVTCEWQPGGSQHLELRVDGQPQQFEMSVFPLGSDLDYVGWAVILANITAQVELVKELQKHAETDALTEVANRRAFDATLARECGRAARYGSPFALMLIDVDHFKAVNDWLGHTGGDAALRGIVHCIGSCLRSTDFLSRYGGDEFAILLPETDLREATEVAERIRMHVEREMSDDSRHVHITISIGLSGFTPGTSADLQCLFRQADEALYTAKSEGRNRVKKWPGLMVLSSPPTRVQ